MSTATESPARGVSDALPKYGPGQSPASKRNLWRGKQPPAHHPAAALGTDWQPMHEAMKHVSTKPASHDRTHQHRNLRAWLRADADGFLSGFVRLQKTLAKPHTRSSFLNSGGNPAVLASMRLVLGNPASMDNTQELRQLRRWLRSKPSAFLRRLVELEGPALRTDAFIREYQEEQRFEKELKEFERRAAKEQKKHTTRLP